MIYIVIIHAPSVTPKLSREENIGKRKYHQDDDKIQDFTHDKLPKIRVVVMH